MVSLARNENGDEVSSQSTAGMIIGSGVFSFIFKHHRYKCEQRGLLTLWRPLLPYGYSCNLATCARPGWAVVRNFWHLGTLTMSKIINDGLTQSGTICLYRCIHMATVGVKGLTSAWGGDEQGLTKKQTAEPSCQLTPWHLLLYYTAKCMHICQLWLWKTDNQVTFYICSFNKWGNVDRKWQNRSQMQNGVITYHNCNYSTVHTYNHWM